MPCWNNIFNKNAILEEIAENFDMDEHIQRWEDETYNEINGWGDIETRQILECVYEIFTQEAWWNIQDRYMYKCEDEMSYLFLNINEYDREIGAEGDSAASFYNYIFNSRTPDELKANLYPHSIEIYMERFLMPDIIKVCKKLMEKKVKNIFEKYITHLNNTNKKKTINKIIINTPLPIELINKISEISV